MKILYIEDNPESIYSVKRIADYFKHELLVGENIRRGLELLNEQPRLVLIDMLLPDGDAIAFTKQARDRWPTLPIIVLTGFAMKGEREACFEAGCTDYYIKPIDMAVLIKIFNHYNEIR